MERYKTFTVLMASITRSIRRIKSEEMQKWNLKSNHLSCLYYLYEKGTLTAKELCDICGEDKANISRSIEYLLENGFLKYESDTQKRYNNRLTLTEKGVDVGKGIYLRIEEILQMSDDGLSCEQRDTMYMALAMIDRNLQKINDEYHS